MTFQAVQRGLPGRLVTISGRQSKIKAHGYGQNEFVPWQLGEAMWAGSSGSRGPSRSQTMQLTKTSAFIGSAATQTCSEAALGERQELADGSRSVMLAVSHKG